MKNVSLNKISKSLATRIAGLSVLAIVALAFCIIPLASFAMDVCGNEHITVKAQIFVMSYINNPTTTSPQFKTFTGGTVPNGSIVIGTHDIRVSGKAHTGVPALAVVVGNQVFGLDYDTQLAMSENRPHHATLLGVTVNGKPQAYVNDKSINVKSWLNGAELTSYIQALVAGKNPTSPTFMPFVAGTTGPNCSFLVGTRGGSNTPAFAVVAGNHAYGLDYQNKPGNTHRPDVVTLLNAKIPVAPVTNS